MLTTQKRKFALALMSGKNKTASAIAAGYSAKTARVKGSQLAKDPEVLNTPGRRMVSRSRDRLLTLSVKPMRSQVIRGLIPAW